MKRYGVILSICIYICFLALTTLLYLPLFLISWFLFSTKSVCYLCTSHLIFPMTKLYYDVYLMYYTIICFHIYSITMKYKNHVDFLSLIIKSIFIECGCPSVVIVVVTITTWCCCWCRGRDGLLLFMTPNYHKPLRGCSVLTFFPSALISPSPSQCSLETVRSQVRGTSEQHTHTHTYTQHYCPLQHHTTLYRNTCNVIHTNNMFKETQAEQKLI